MTMLELMTLFVSAYFTFLYIQTKLWIANNVMAICFAIYCVEHWLVGNFRNIFLIFVGLILYDISFVFGSDVMMTVAQGIDLPVKILIPMD
jgi:minor histocompatibility antigen H13